MGPVNSRRPCVSTEWLTHTHDRILNSIGYKNLNSHPTQDKYGEDSLASKKKTKENVCCGLE